MRDTIKKNGGTLPEVRKQAVKCRKWNIQTKKQNLISFLEKSNVLKPMDQWTAECVLLRFPATWWFKCASVFGGLRDVLLEGLQTSSKPRRKRAEWSDVQVGGVPNGALWGKSYWERAAPNNLQPFGVKMLLVIDSMLRFQIIRPLYF